MNILKKLDLMKRKKYKDVSWVRLSQKIRKTVYYNYLGKIRAKIIPFMVAGNR